MFKQSLTAVAVASLSLSAVAQEPNIEPGMWETTSTVSLNIPNMPEGSMPPQTQTESNCITPEDIRDGEAFLADNEECEVADKEISADGMSFTMTCPSPDGSAMTMNADMSFDGDTMSGTVDGQMDSAMGSMTMSVEISGKRTGDC
ncbi:DUF3617 domain-containing protein [Halomonas denitrificans]|nr:DUF3617 domain-containing protein [Halomonas denitrificans]